MRKQSIPGLPSFRGWPGVEAKTLGWGTSVMVKPLPWPSSPSPDSAVSGRSSVVGSVGGSAHPPVADLGLAKGGFH